LEPGIKVALNKRSEEWHKYFYLIAGEHDERR
jgi:hypothetical protein